MKLPIGNLAIVDIRKLQAYCLNPQHPRGRYKARVFAAVGFREADADELRALIVTAAAESECALGAPSPHGQRYVLDFGVTRQGRIVKIRTTWIVRTGENLPRLTSCFVL